MSREVHVRFCEGPKVKLLRPTHPYIPIGRGFLYLVAIIDWASRAVLAWRLSNTMDVSFCLAALEEALASFGRPEIFNTDQGSQFTSAAFTGALADRAPMAVWREAVARAGPVDMMDNASALPTCPQSQQQTQPLAA